MRLRRRLPLPILDLDMHVAHVLQRLDRSLITEDIPRVHHRERNNQQRQQERHHRDNHPLDVERPDRLGHAPVVGPGAVAPPSRVPSMVPVGIVTIGPVALPPAIIILCMAPQGLDQQWDHGPDHPDGRQGPV